MATLITNPRGIPKAPFVEKVEDFVGAGEAVEPTLQKFQESVSKYKYMEIHLLQRKTSLQSKLPEIQKTLDMVKLINEKNQAGLPLQTDFELCETLYSSAIIDPTDKVHLWLGANVMLEYPIDEAMNLLQSKLKAATSKLAEVEEDLEFLREQITTMEVNVARLYNFDVKKKRTKK